jgi:protocatechuate 3,4-dioxygenase beta subunit
MLSSATGRALLALLAAAYSFQAAFALITGAAGNEPLTDPGWPQGAAAIFNNPARVAHWVGPPFGSGQWHAECRGDAKAFNAVLKDFVKLEAPVKTLVVHDGVGRSFWLNPNREPAHEEAARVDWVFEVWHPASWQRLRNMPAGLLPPDVAREGPGPPARIDVYVGGNIRWADVDVPEEIELRDERLEAHGFSAEDGVVLEGDVTDAVTQDPVAGARVKLERTEAKPTGGYQYDVAAEAAADAKGHWVIRKAPAGRHRVIAEADGYVARVVGYDEFDESPQWQSFNGQLARPATVSGRVIDEAGAPLADADVRLADAIAADGVQYNSPSDYDATTDAEGRFTLEGVPAGTSTVRAYKPLYVRPGVGTKIEAPAENIELRMTRAAHARVHVEFPAARPAEYIVEITPKGGNKIGSWGGSAQIDETNSYTFRNVPPGEYVITGRPNPSREGDSTQPHAVQLKAGKMSSIRLQAR